MPSLDPEFSAIVFGGMIQRIREEAGMIDWRHVITTALVTTGIAAGAFYVSVQKDIVEIKTMISSRVAQRESQFASIGAEMNTLHVRDRELDERIEMTRMDMLLCRERVASLEAQVQRK